MKRLYYMVCSGAIAVLLAACSDTTSDTEQYIQVDKQVDEANQYEDFKEVTDRDKVEKVQAILQEADWVTAKVEMIRYPDYRFGLKLSDSKPEAKAVKYKLWISSKGDIIELVRQDKYVQLFEILTGEKLAEQ